MNIFRRCLLIILSFWLLAVILPERAEAEHIKRRHTRPSYERIHIKKNYRYIRSNGSNSKGVTVKPLEVIQSFDTDDSKNGIVKDGNGRPLESIESFDTDVNRSETLKDGILKGGNGKPRELIESFDTDETGRD